MNKSNHVLVVDKLIKSYDNGLVKALSGITLRIDEGEIVSIMGPSGCGKSTLLNLLGALDTPDSGEIIFHGSKIADQKPLTRWRAQNIGFIFQFHHLIPALTLIENVEMQLIPLGISKNVRIKKATSLLAALGLNGRNDFLPLHTSGGERQRAAIARALVHRPKLVLADEPTGNLDTATGNQAMGHLISQCRQLGATAIIATHNPEIADLADRTIWMRNGKIEDQVDGGHRN